MLDVYLNKHLIGQLSCGRSGWVFRYDPRWQTASHGFDLVPTLQRTAGDIADTTKAQPVRNFFEYLLPEPAREAPKVAAAALDHLAELHRTWTAHLRWSRPATSPSTATSTA
ncbi:hypothetical protein ACEQUB_02572 [Ralstonia syzygii]